MAQRLKYYDSDVDFAPSSFPSFCGNGTETITFSYKINYKERMRAIKAYMLHVVRSTSSPFIIRRNKTTIANYISLHRRIDLTFKGLIKTVSMWWWGYRLSLWPSTTTRFYRRLIANTTLNYEIGIIFRRDFIEIIIFLGEFRHVAWVMEMVAWVRPADSRDCRFREAKPSWESIKWKQLNNGIWINWFWSWELRRRTLTASKWSTERSVMLVRGAHDNNNSIMEFKRNCIAQLIGLVDQARGFVVS